MGMWAFNPWDNDSAADWYGEFMDETKLRSVWLKGIKKDAIDEFEEVRAAVSIYLMLGRVYVWPIDHLDEDLALCIKQTEKMLSDPENLESEELIAEIKAELTELKSRETSDSEVPQSSDSPAETKAWWAFWK